MFSLHQVKIFLTVATEGSISRAAELLYLSQPAVSQHIRSLEKGMGAELLVRGRRGVTLTPAGETFLKYAQELLQLSREAREATQLAATSRTLHRYLHIGATPGVGACLLPHWMGDFHNVSQHVTPTLKILPTPELVRQVHNQELAFAIGGDMLGRAVVEVTPLWDEESVIAVGPGHPWWQRPFVEAEELDGQSFVMRENNSLAHAWELQSLAEFGVNPRPVAEFSTPAAIKQAVIAGMGIAVLPCFSIKNELDVGRMWGVRFRTGVMRRTIYFLWTLKGLKAPGANLFVQYLIENYEQLAVCPITNLSPNALASLLQHP